MTERVGSYPSIFQAGHRALATIFDDPVLVEEKIDGSQFSFGVYDGVLRCRSKGKQLEFDENGACIEKMFTRAIETARVLAEPGMLRNGWTYRCEYLQKPKHNTTAYARTPTGYLILFDIETAPQTFLTWDEKAHEAECLGLEVVPRLFEGRITSAEQLRALIPTESVLGGAKAEGVVAKNYAQFGPDKKILIAKCVREGYAEENAKECREMIRDALWAHAWPQIRRGITAGLPEWYKRTLMEEAFAPSPDEADRMIATPIGMIPDYRR